MSPPPPGGKPTMMRTGRDGYAGAPTTRDVAGSTMATVAKCRKVRRSIFCSFRFRMAPLRSLLTTASANIHADDLTRSSISCYPYDQSSCEGAMNLQDRVSHRLKLRDLRLLLSVMESGSMAKAAAHLNLTQSGVSKAIGDLEHTLGVRLFDRTARGVEPTLYGHALRKWGN